MQNNSHEETNGLIHVLKNERIKQIRNAAPNGYNWIAGNGLGTGTLIKFVYLCFAFSHGVVSLTYEFEYPFGILNFSFTSANIILHI